MKCPKCGYNSFESIDICAKCSHDLTAHKSTFGLQPVVLQKEVRLAMASALAAQEPEPEAAPELVEQQQPDDIFSFDLPDDEQTQTPEQTTTIMETASTLQPETITDGDILKAFSLSDEPAESTSTMETQDVFADLVETTRQETAVDPLFPDATRTFADETTTKGEYDLTNFTWDDTPEPSPSSPPKPVDDFDSLFGDTKKADEK